MKSSDALIRVRRLMINKKVGTFLICLGIASLLWVVHVLNRNYKYTILVPVKFLNLPSHKLIVGELPERLSVDIKANGLKLLFISMRKNLPEMVIDFNLLKNNAKTQAYNINNSYFNLKQCINTDVEILKIRPDTLFFSISKWHSKLLPVKPDLKINCVEGFHVVTKPIINPAYVSVSGDSISLSKMDTVYTYYLNLKNVKENFLNTIALKKPYSNINYNVKDVQVSFNVDKLIETSIKVPIHIRNKDDKNVIKLLPSYTTITYLVAMKDFDNIHEDSFKAVVDYDLIKNKQKELPIEIIRSPEEIKISNISPSNITYLIYK